MSNFIGQRQRSPRKLLIQLSGAPGSGKSTTAKVLAPLIDGVILDHDVLRSSILEADIAFKQAARMAYRLNWTLTESLLRQDKNVIIDSPCNYREIVDRGSALAQHYGFEYWYVECRTDDIDLLDRRLRNRTALRSQRTGILFPPSDSADTSGTDEDARALFQKWIEYPCRPDHNVVTIDATSDLEARCHYLLKQIGLTLVG